MKNLYTLILPAMMFFSIACSQNDDAQFPQKSNDAYKYTFVEKYEPLQGQIIEPSVDVKIDKHYFDNGITRTKLTIRPENDQKVTVTETWTTSKPSLTAAGIAAYTALYGSAAAAGLYLGNYVGTALGIRDVDRLAAIADQQAVDRQAHLEAIKEQATLLGRADREVIRGQAMLEAFEELKGTTNAEALKADIQAYTAQIEKKIATYQEASATHEALLNQLEEKYRKKNS